MDREGYDCECTVELEVLRRVAAFLESFGDFEVGPAAVGTEGDIALGVLHGSWTWRVGAAMEGEGMCVGRLYCRKMMKWKEE